MALEQRDSTRRVRLVHLANVREDGRELLPENIFHLGMVISRDNDTTLGFHPLLLREDVRQEFTFDVILRNGPAGYVVNVVVELTFRC